MAAKSSRKDQFKMKISDINVLATSETEDVYLDVYESHQKFQAEDGKLDALLKVYYKDYPQSSYGSKIFASHAVWDLYEQDDKQIVTFTSPVIDNQPYRVAVFSQDYQSGELYIRPYEKLAIYKSDKRIAQAIQQNQQVKVQLWEYPLDEFLIVNLLARKSGLIIHASGVISENKGYIFCGQSGAGKSTLTNMFKKHNEMTILSDDRVAVRQHDDSFIVYGTPWHGDSRVCSNNQAPLTGIYFLKQSAENNVQRLTEMQTIQRLFKCCFPTFYNQSAMDSTVGLMKNLAKRIPCFEFGFKADDSAVDFLFDKSKGDL